MPCHALNRGAIEQRGAVLEGGFPLACRILDQVQRQVELGDPAYGAHRRQRQARHLQGLHRRVLQDHHDLEQRRMALMALQLQCLDQMFERHILIGVSVERGAAHLVEQIDKAGGAVDPCAQGEHVQKEADQGFDFSPVTIRNCGANADVMLAAIARQQDVEDGIEQHEWRCLPLLRKAGEERTGRRRDHHAVLGACMAWDRTSRPVGRQVDQVGGERQLAGPVGELPLVAGEPLALPVRVVRVLDYQLRQRRRFAAHERSVQRRHFPHQHAHRPAVGNDMVQGDEDHVLVVCDL